MNYFFVSYKGGINASHNFKKGALYLVTNTTIANGLKYYHFPNEELNYRSSCFEKVNVQNVFSMNKPEEAKPLVIHIPQFFRGNDMVCFTKTITIDEILTELWNNNFVVKAQSRYYFIKSF